MITKDTINIHRLVDDIHAAEAAKREGKWSEFCKDRGMRFADYARFVTGLYTLRAWLRGKLHRQNPPEEIRDFNRTVQEQGLPYPLREWDATEHNRKLAEKIADGYRVEPTAETGVSPCAGQTPVRGQLPDHRVRDVRWGETQAQEPGSAEGQARQLHV